MASTNLEHYNDVLFVLKLFFFGLYIFLIAFNVLLWKRVNDDESGELISNESSGDLPPSI